MHSEFFEELDLDDNLIGDLAAREIIEALEFRKEGKFINCQMNAKNDFLLHLFISHGNKVLRLYRNPSVHPSV